MELTEWKEKALDTIKGELTPNNRNNGSGNGSKSGNNHGNQYGDSTEERL